MTGNLSHPAATQRRSGGEVQGADVTPMPSAPVPNASRPGGQLDRIADPYRGTRPASDASPRDDA